MNHVKHVKLEFDPVTYEAIREAAYQARTPIRRWCMDLVARAAAEKTGIQPPPPSHPTQHVSTTATS